LMPRLLGRWLIASSGSTWPEPRTSTCGVRRILERLSSVCPELGDSKMRPSNFAALSVLFSFFPLNTYFSIERVFLVIVTMSFESARTTTVQDSVNIYKEGYGCAHSTIMKYLSKFHPISISLRASILFLMYRPHEYIANPFSPPCCAVSSVDSKERIFTGRLTAFLTPWFISASHLTPFRWPLSWRKSTFRYCQVPRWHKDEPLIDKRRI
jgi:hypothetical protein